MTSPELKAACDAYWSAKTPEAERIAYRRMRQLGVPPSYGELPDLQIDDPWQFGGYDSGLLTHHPV